MILSDRRISLLKSFAVESDTPVNIAPTGARLVVLLAIEGPQRRSEIAACLWPDADTEHGLSALRTVVSRIKRSAPGLVQHNGDRLALADSYVCDYAIVRTWAYEVVEQHKIQAAPPDTVKDLLPTWDEHWLIEPREEFRLLRLTALELTTSQLLSAGQLASACRHALMAVRIDPLRESANRLLVEIHMREGNVAEAIRRYRSFESKIRLIGARPGMALQAMVATLAPGIAQQQPRRAVIQR